MLGSLEFQLMPNRRVSFRISSRIPSGRNYTWPLSELTADRSRATLRAPPICNQRPFAYSCREYERLLNDYQGDQACANLDFATVIDTTSRPTKFLRIDLSQKTLIPAYEWVTCAALKGHFCLWSVGLSINIFINFNSY